MQLNSFMTDIIASELEDAVGRENCSTREIDKLTHSVDYFWLSRMWADRGERIGLLPVDMNPPYTVVSLRNIIY